MHPEQANILTLNSDVSNALIDGVDSIRLGIFCEHQVGIAATDSRMLWKVSRIPWWGKRFGSKFISTFSSETQSADQAQ